MPRLNMQRARTADRGPPGANRAPIHTVGQIGPKRKLLPNGALLCEDVPIARTGVMMYQPGEVPIKPPTRPGAAQVLYVTRDRMTLFAPESLGSVVGAAITNDHPPTDVTPDNWQTLAKGHVQDAWQGEGENADLMFADIIIADKGLIHKVNTNEIREVSLGYTADYEQTGDGEGRQRRIVINHLALVERGRCGPRCAIGDRQTLEEELMPQTQAGGQRPRNRLDAIRAELDTLEQQEEDGVHVHVHMPTNDRATVTDPDADPDDVDTGRTHDALAERLDGVEEAVTDMRGMMATLLERFPAPGAGNPLPTGTTAATGDSAALQTSFQAFIAQAEILVPGYKVPTFDSALPRAKTVDTMCAGRRSVLTTLAATTDGTALLGQVTDEGFDIATSDCASVSTVFKAAAALKGTANNRAATGDRLTIPANAVQPIVTGGGITPLTADQINEANAKYWAGR